MSQSSHDLLSALEYQLMASAPAFDEVMNAAIDLRSHADSQELLSLSLIYRAARAFQSLVYSVQRPAEDAVVLLRQVIRTFGRRIYLHPSLWKQCELAGERAGLVSSPGEDFIEIRAADWCPNWLEGAAKIDHLEPRRIDSPAIGDGILYRASSRRWLTYQSMAQRTAVDAWQFATPGSTTIVVLPTGAGKTLTFTLPAWLESYGGQRPGGTTLVVVPTVALAIDQRREARRMFRDSGAPDYSLPTSFTGTTSDEKRREIQRGIENGTLPILFTSPEALLESNLYRSCLNAARNGNLTRLVIDEAHIVEAWGAGFRADFQFLSGYRRRLIDESGGRLRTLLLSATITQSCMDLLETLFVGSDPLVLVEALRLRPEPSYWLHMSKYRPTRDQHVVEALYYLPRPSIVYVTEREHAEDLRRSLVVAGFSSIATFTGDTPDQDRAQIIQEWDKDNIDIIVATSAFGLGVNKSSVRTILHATIPETVDRFYQEVGRSGRDGFSSISLVCAAKRDEETAHGMIPQRITSPVAFARWRGLWEDASSYQEQGGIWLIDRNSTPINDREMHRSTRNREWNDHVILLMQRAGLIEVLDTRDVPRMDEQFQQRIPIHILDTDINNEAHFTSCIETIRKQERDTGKQSMRTMLRVIEHYHSGKFDRCIAHEFERVYPGAQLSCGGCPYCRKEEQPAYTERDLALTLRYSSKLIDLRERHLIAPKLARLIGNRSALNVVWDGQRSIKALERYAGLFAELVHSGFNQVILPQALSEDPAFQHTFVESLAEFRPNRAIQPQRILVDTWLVQYKEYPLHNLPTLVVYPSIDATADRLHNVLEQRLHIGAPRVNVIFRSLTLTSNKRLFRDHVDGLDIDIEHLVQQIHAH